MFFFFFFFFSKTEPDRLKECIGKRKYRKGNGNVLQCVMREGGEYSQHSACENRR